MKWGGWNNYALIKKKIAIVKHRSRNLLRIKNKRLCVDTRLTLLMILIRNSPFDIFRLS